MKVLGIENSRFNNNLCFQSSIRRYSPKNTSLPIFSGDIIRTSTNLFREDLDWRFLTEYILFNFLNTKKVNIYSLASSDGSEAYSLAIMLLHKLPEKIYSKFFPIHASDIDKNIVEAANKRRINIHDFEFYYAKKNYNVDLNYYFEKQDKPIKIKNDDIDWTNPLYSYTPIDELKQSVEFKKSDILTELEKMHDEGNSVVMCRNVMPYLNEDYIENVLKTAERVLKTGSLFVTGDYDCRVNITKRLLDNGFFRPSDDYHNIFQKR